jgi:hypothetical protein
MNTRSAAGRAREQDLVYPADCRSDSDRPGFGGVARGAGVQLNGADGIADGEDEQSLALGIVDVHGPAAAAVVARGNARAAALAGQKLQAKFWIRVLGIIQRHRVGRAMGGSPPLVRTPTPTH